ncbi:capsule biosynthesis protein [Rhizobium paknamense]|uniref:Capsular polysaccharide export protein n=1 Tax=Rhizobium paknamense TaxID=1206817 RepID=A0ABU0IJI9_9HYPH|nr:capsular biosynthesis protein [Rhizobium paknamense]MDQ0457374.1 capsular polysaccharide export protein [Rhizobium paknamense]
MTETRNFLFLQGPASPFLRHLAAALERRGASVHKINVCLGDILFWRRWPIHVYRGPDTDWKAYLDDFLYRHAITDLVMLGDGREKHAAAIALARSLGLRVHIFEHGYLRPDWLTLEPFGMSSQSCFPADPHAIRQLAAKVAPPAQTSRRYRASFLTYALYDLSFHVPNVLLGWLVHPHYRAHGPVHPAVEYAGWIGKALTMRKRHRNVAALQDFYLGRKPRFFLFPLQLPGDYQIRRHAPTGNLLTIMEATMASFARHAEADVRLLFKVHPIDNGLNRWQSRIAAMASRHGVAERVDFIEGGDLDALITASQGLVTVNSTVGLTALQANRPVIALAPAIYDVPGLTHQGPLATFWTRPEQPDATLLQALLRAMTGTIQVRGGFLDRQSVIDGAEAMAERLFSPPMLPSSPAPERAIFRYEAELRAAFQSQPDPQAYP